jgi:hypothetical protein
MPDSRPVERHLECLTIDSESPPWRQPRDHEPTEQR